MSFLINRCTIIFRLFFLFFSFMNKNLIHLVHWMCVFIKLCSNVDIPNIVAVVLIIILYYFVIFSIVSFCFCQTRLMVFAQHRLMCVVVDL